MRMRLLARALWADSRALTVAFVKLIMSLGLGAAVLWVIFEAQANILPDARSAAPGGLGGIQMADWLVTGKELLPFVFLFVAFFGFIVRAVFERRSVR